MNDFHKEMAPVSADVVNSINELANPKWAIPFLGRRLSSVCKSQFKEADTKGFSKELPWEGQVKYESHNAYDDSTYVHELVVAVYSEGPAAGRIKSVRAHHWEYWHTFSNWQDHSESHTWEKREPNEKEIEQYKESVAAAVRSKVAKRRDFEKVNVDTTVQEKNVRFPTDARTLDRARERVVAVGEKLGIRFKRTYVRKGKTMLRKLLAQDRDTPGKDKIYSFHEPQVECIAKGKVHTRYEFGVKASFVTASRTNWVLGAMAIPGNPYDGNTLAEVLKQAESICGTKPGHAYCDLGYRGHNYTGDIDIQVVNRFRRKRPRALLRWWKRRSAIEPVIGHIKSDHGMDRNMLAGSTGDKLNAMLAGVGFNLLKLMKGLGRLFLYLHAEAAGFAEFLSAFVRFWLCDAPQLRHPLSSRCGLLKLGFA